MRFLAKKPASLGSTFRTFAKEIAPEPGFSTTQQGVLLD